MTLVIPLRRNLALINLSARLLMADPGSIISLTAFPLILAPFLIPAAEAQLRSAGYMDATGGDQVIPGLAVLSSFLFSQTVVMLFFKEYAWGTWTRMRTQPVSTFSLIVGKLVPSYAALGIQLGAVLSAGALFFGFSPRGSVVALITIVAVFSLALLGFSIMAVAISRTVDQAMMIAALGGMLLAGLGGALGPTTGLPNWVQTIAHVSPAWWALDAARRITLDGAGVSDVLPAIGVIAIFASVFAVIAGLSFRADTEKVGLT